MKIRHAYPTLMVIATIYPNVSIPPRVRLNQITVDDYNINSAVNVELFWLVDFSLVVTNQANVSYLINLNFVD